MLKLHESGNKTALHFGDGIANVPILFIECQKLPLHGIMKLAEIRTTDRLTNRDKYIRSGFHQNAFIDGEVNRSIRFGFVSQNAGRKCGNTVESVF
jgi:hypothetical protein